MPKRKLERSIIGSSSEDLNYILSQTNEYDTVKSRKLLKTKSKIKEKPTFFSQPESLFLQFDPKHSENINSQSKDVNSNITQLTGKKSWQPPTKQCFDTSKHEVTDKNVTLNLDQQSYNVDSVQDQNEDEIVVLSEIHLAKSSGNLEGDDNILEEVEKLLVNNKSDKRIDIQEESNDIFGHMNAHEIDELIDKKIEDYLSAECEVEKETQLSEHQGVACEQLEEVRIVSGESDDELKISKNHSNETHTLGENSVKSGKDENKLLQEEMLKKSPTFVKQANVDAVVKDYITQNLDTDIDTFDDKEEKEFDLTDSQFFQIEKEYCKIKKQDKFVDCSTQTTPISGLQHSIDIVPQMTGSLRKLKNDVLKIQQCVQELKKIDAILIKARKEVRLKTNGSQAWYSSTTKNNQPQLHDSGRSEFLKK